MIFSNRGIDTGMLQQIAEEFRIYSDRMGKLINAHLENLSPSDKDYKKKSIELCHIGKFLTILNENFIILSVGEQPDCIISNSNERVGLEHCIIVENGYKKQEGTSQNIFEKAEHAFRKQFPVLKFLANIWINSDKFVVRKSEYPRIIEEIVTVIHTYYVTGELINNQFINRISISFHTDIIFIPYSGAWIQKYLPEEELKRTIVEKEKLLPIYLSKNNLKKQWLLIVIGGASQSSYRIRNNVNKLNSLFDRVYLMEDFASKIFRIK